MVRERDLADLKKLPASVGFAHSRSPHLEKHSFKSRDSGDVDAYTSRIGKLPVEEGLFKRSRHLPFGGVEVCVVSLEDLVMLKLSAARETDLADVAVLFAERGEEIDASLLAERAGVSELRRRAREIVDLLPAEYGWQARGKLKRWLREKGWSGPK